MRLKQIIKIVDTIMIREPYLDVGCSNGFITNKIVSKYCISQATGFDHNKDNLKIASERYPDIEFKFINLNILNTFDNKFKFITCFETLEHVGNLENALINLINLINYQGTLLISVPVETGLIGLIKFLIKTIFYSYNLKELDNRKSIYFKYLFTLLSGKSVSQFRSIRDGYGTHFGFDHKCIESILYKSDINFKKFVKSATAYFLINK